MAAAVPPALEMSLPAVNQRYKSIFFLNSTSTTKVFSDDATKPNLPITFNIDISQIILLGYSHSDWINFLLPKCSELSRAEAGSTDPKGSWLWSLSSWEKRRVNTALKPNGLRHLNPAEKNEERQTHKEIKFREKGTSRQWCKKQGTKVDSEKTSLPAKSKWEPGNAESLSKMH